MTMSSFPSGRSAQTLTCLLHFVIFADIRSGVKFSVASEAIRDARWDGSGAGFGLSFGLLNRSQDFTPTTPDSESKVKIYFFKF